MDNQIIKLICLSDFHFNEETDRYLDNKKEALINVLKSEFRNFGGKIVFIISGDIADRGKEKEYELAYKFINTILNQLGSADISFIFSPGNHDCNLELLTKTERKDRKVILSKNYLNYDDFKNYKQSFINPFKNYNAFISRFDKPKIVNSNVFFTTYHFESKSKYSIKIVSFNSALFYNIEPSNLSIAFDDEFIKNNLTVNTNEINIYISHYPIEWFNRNKKDNYSSLIRKNDFLICGHEHDFEVSNIGNLQYIKLPSMANVDEAEKSEFNILEINEKTGNYVLKGYIYNGINYGLSDLCNEGRIKNKIYMGDSIIPINESAYNKIVNDNLLPISDPKFKYIDDVFIEPKLGKKVLENGVLRESFIYFSEIDFDSNDSFIFKGHNRYGKTLLLKKIFSNCFLNGLIPIYIELKSSKSIEKLSRIIEERFIETYSKDYLDYYNQYRDKVVLLIDNINNVKNIKSDFFESFREKGFEKIICTFNIDYSDLDDNLFDLEKIMCYEIKEIKQEQRYLLVSKWVEKVELNKDDAVINEILTKLNECFESGEDCSVEMAWIFLEAYKDNKSNDLVNGSKVIYYRYLFDKYVLNINEGTQINDSKFVEDYLSFFAYYQFTHMDCFNKDEFDQLCLDNIEISRRLYFEKSELINKYCEKNKLSVFTDEEIKFYNSYALSFFTAKYYNYYNDNKAEILSLMDDLSCSEKANVILFYVGMTNDTDIKNKIIDINEKLFAKFNKLDCEKDVEIFDMFIIKDAIKISDKSKDIKKNNIELYKKVDQDNRNHIKKKTVDALEKELLESKRVMEISKEIILSSPQKPFPKRIIKALYEMQLRKAESLIELFMYYIKELCSEEKEVLTDEEAIKFDKLLRLTIAALATLIIIIPEYSVPKKYYYLLDEIVLENNNTINKLVSCLMELFSIRGTNNDPDYNKIISMIKQFDESKKNFSLLLIKYAIHREINYVGMNDKARRTLLDKLNNFSNSIPPKDPKKRIDYDKKSKERRLLDLK